MRALDRMLSIVEAVAARHAPSAPSHVADATGLSLSTVSRQMQQLADLEVLARPGESASYVLGPRLFALTAAGMEQHGLRRVARPVLESLRDHTGETTSLHVRSGSQRVCIDQVPSSYAIARILLVGATYPLLGSATGEVLLAGATPGERQRLLDAEQLSAADRTDVEQRLALAREQGYVISINRWARGIASVSAPVLSSGATLGAMSVSGPMDRFTPERAREVAPLLRETASGLWR